MNHSLFLLSFNLVFKADMNMFHCLEFVSGLVCAVLMLKGQVLRCSLTAPSAFSPHLVTGEKWVLKNHLL